MSPILLVARLSAALASASPQAAGTVEVRFTGAEPGGPVMVQLCTPAEDMMTCALRAHTSVEGGVAVARFENVPAGRYAASAYQDVNSNSRLDFTRMGPPSEPWAYSRDARGQYGPPSFSDAAVSVPAEGAVIPMHLAY